MDSEAPTFRKPDYEPERHDQSARPVLETVGGQKDLAARDENLSQVASSKQDNDDGKIVPAKTETDALPESHHHLMFSKATKSAIGHASKKLHLHRETGRGPSEARQRRQSHFPTDADDNTPHLPVYIHLRNAVFGSLTMFTSFPYWDMAFWSGWSYTWGSIIFVIDGLWAWTPLQWPQSEFAGESEYGVGLLFFIGAIFYQLGATMAYLEAINDGSFAGRAMKRHVDGHDEEMKRYMDDKLHLFFGHMIPHHHHDDDDDDDDENVQDVEKQTSTDTESGWKTRNPDQSSKPSFPKDKGPAPRRGGVDMGPTDEDEFHEYLTWRWWPTWHALKTYHIKDMGYVACSIQLFGATLYGICGVISLPGILSNFEPWQALGGYYVPQTVASLCFLTAGIMFTLITQEKWYRPLPRRIAWWIGVWAAIGSVGFVLSAVFGLAVNDYTWCAYQSPLSSTWGSLAYLTSSWLQWYESVNKGPVLAFPNNRVPVGMRLHRS